MTQNVAVMGMHRSGTSAVTELITTLGHSAGDLSWLMDPDPHDNARGYWERPSVCTINDEILRRLGGDAWQPPPAPSGFERRPELADLVERARAEIAALASCGTPWVVKDPRFSITYPLWRLVDGPDLAIVCIRRPQEVAASLRRRYEHADKRPFFTSRPTHGRCHEIWHRYVAGAMEAVAPQHRLVVDYAQLTADPVGERDRIARFLRVVDVPPGATTTVDPGLRHHRGADAIRRRPVRETRADRLYAKLTR